MADKFEYLCQLFVIGAEGIQDDSERLLNQLGGDGWSLVQGFRVNDQQVLMIFQRPQGPLGHPSREW